MGKQVLSRQSLILVAACIFIAAIGLLVGHSQGGDLDAATAEGRATGAEAGAKRGTELGYRAGYRTAYADASQKAFRSAKKRAMKRGATSIKATPVLRECGDLAEEGAGTYSVRSENVVCDIARQVAYQWESQCAATSCSVPAGFACSTVQVGYELSNTTCLSGSRKVTFESGS